MFKYPRAQKDCSTHWIKKFKSAALSAAFLLTFGTHSSYSADLATLQKLPLLTMSNLEYAGGFRIPSDNYGESNVTYSDGPMTLGANAESIYVVGHAQHQAIGEFKIPALVNSINVGDFKYATVVQGFSRVLNRPESGNSQALDLIGGLGYVNGRLIVNALMYYDASNSVTDTTMVVRDASKLSSSSIGGYLRLPGKSHASGWISPVPLDWQAVLGGTHITGYSSGGPIISRHSVGPSAFAFNPASPDLGTLAARSTIATTALLDFSLDHPIGGQSLTTTTAISNYLSNTTLSNLLWNQLATARYGFVIPGTRTYMAIGSIGGISSAVGYKITQDNGTLCGGYCPYKASDNYNYYWLFDLNDLLKVKAGQIQPYNIVPYAYGKFDKPQPVTGFNPIVGGGYDNAKNILYLLFSRGDRPAPSVGAYKINVAGSGSGTTSSPPTAPGNPVIKVLN